MNLTIFSMVFPEPLPSVLFMPLLDKLPANLQQTVLKFRNWPDAHASLLGKHLLKHAMKAAGYTPSLDQLRYSDHQRPYFDQYPDFNISHSGHRVVCVVNAQGPVGIDLEARSPLPIDDFKTQFSPTEWTHITNASDPLSVFYDYWTAKESVIKADGRGLSIPLSTLEITPINTRGEALYHAPGEALYHAPGEALYHAPGEPLYHAQGTAPFDAPEKTTLLGQQQWFLQRIDIDRDYACHLAGNTRLPAPAICQLTPEQLLASGV